MFQNNSRIYVDQGISFYERDVLYDDHTYVGDLDITIKLNYYSPGFGLIFMNNEGVALEEQNEFYTVKVGNRDASIFYNNKGQETKLKENAFVVPIPIDNVTFRVVKTGKVIQCYFDDMTMPCVEYTMPIHWDKYSLGIYSSAGNKVESISIASGIPKYWTVNMYNTDGGYIKFLRDGFSIENCHDKAELEQEKIALKKGKYYLQYKTEEVKGLYDIEAFVFFSNSEESKDEKKNILNDESYFILEEDQEVTLKFKGRNGGIKQIQFALKENSNYVSTEDMDDTDSLGSYIKINTKGLSKIWWSGQILDLPEISEEDFLNKNKTYFVMATDGERLNFDKAGIEKKQSYNYIYNVQQYGLEITKENLSVMNHKFKLSSKEITIFKNMDAIIDRLSIMREGSNEWEDIISNNESKKYVPSDISSPIVVTTEEGIPLELSSSYRFVKQEYPSLFNEDEKVIKNKFIFTNWEREIFEADASLILEHLPSEEIGSVIIYGLLKNASYDMERFYEISSLMNINDITPLSRFNERIYSSNIKHINYKTGNVVLNEEIVDRYDYIIVDYLKKDNYCINYLADKRLYEVEISTRNKVYMHYDDPIKDEKTGSYQYNDAVYLNNIKITSLKPTDKEFLVLRKVAFFNEDLSVST